LDGLDANGGFLVLQALEQVGGDFLFGGPAPGGAKGKKGGEGTAAGGTPVGPQVCNPKGSNADSVGGRPPKQNYMKGTNRHACTPNLPPGPQPLAHGLVFAPTRRVAI